MSPPRSATSSDRADRVNLTSLRRCLSASALTNPDMLMPEGHYRSASMSQTVVPGRKHHAVNRMGVAESALGEDDVATVLLTGRTAAIITSTPTAGAVL